MIIRCAAILHSDHAVFAIFIRPAGHKHTLRLLCIFRQGFPGNEIEIVQIAFKASDAAQFEHLFQRIRRDMPLGRSKKTAFLLFHLCKDAIVHGGIRRQIELFKHIGITFRVCLQHFRRVIQHDMINLMADNEQDFLQCEFAQQQRIGAEDRREMSQQDAGNAFASEIHFIGQVHEEIAVIAVSLRNEEQLHQLQHLNAVAPHLIKESRSSVSILDGGDIYFYAIQQLRNIAVHAYTPITYFFIPNMPLTIPFAANPINASPTPLERRGEELRLLFP